MEAADGALLLVVSALYDWQGLGVVPVVGLALLAHEMLPPASLTGSNVLMAEWAPIGLRQRLERQALELLGMLFILGD